MKPEITPLAIADLRVIRAYTLARWGAAQETSSPLAYVPPAAPGRVRSIRTTTFPFARPVSR